MSCVLFESVYRLSPLVCSECAVCVFGRKFVSHFDWRWIFWWSSGLSVALVNITSSLTMLLSAGGWCVSVFCSRFSKYQTISWSNSALSLLNVNTENIKWQLLQEKKMKKIHVFYIPCKNSGSRIAACITSLLSALWSVDNMLLRCCSSSYCCVLIVCYYEIDPGQARPLSVLKAPLRCNDQPVMDESQLDRDRCGGHTHTHTHAHTNAPLLQ